MSRCFLAFCGAACRSGRESQLLVVLGPSGRVHSSRRPTDPQLRVQEISKPGQAARTDKRHDPRTRIILGISSRLPIGDPSPIPRRCTPTAPHTTDNFPFVLNSHLANPPPEKTKSHGRAPNRRRIWATHLPSPTPSLPLGRHRMHVHCTTGPVRPGRKPSPAVPVPRHGRKRGPLRCVDQVPRAG